MRRFQLTIAAAVPSGTYGAWIVGRYGISNPLLFHVLRDLVEVAETEPNNVLDQAQAIGMNTLAHGISHQNDQDVFRFAAQAGQRFVVRALAGKLDSAMDPALALSATGGRMLDEAPVAVTPPDDVFSLRAFRFIEHPTDHSRVTSAATSTLTGFQVRAGLPREQGPAVVSGSFNVERDYDVYELEVAEAGPVAIDVYCERIGGRGDSCVTVLDDKGEKVVEVDDYGHQLNVFDGRLRDPLGQTTLTANRKYLLRVHDRHLWGRARYQYVLFVRKPDPDFFVAAIHRSPLGGTTVGRDGVTFLDVIVHATDGIAAPVTVAAENPPPGIVCEPAVIHGKSGRLVIHAAPAGRDREEVRGEARARAPLGRRKQRGDRAAAGSSRAVQAGRSGVRARPAEPVRDTLPKS